jgi:ABC-type transporter Mla MlaB component
LVSPEREYNVMFGTPSLVKPNITLYSLSGETTHYIIVPLWKDQTLHYTPSLERPNITLYSLSGETKHYIIVPLWKDHT